MRWTVALALASSLAACSIQETPPATQVDRLRVLSIRIDGPSSRGGLAELAPGDVATLTPLVLAPGMSLPSAAGQEIDMTVPQAVCLEDYDRPRWDRGASGCPSVTAPVYRFWFWCPPQAATLYNDPCTDTSLLSSPALIFGSTGIQPLGPMVGSDCPTAATPTPTPVACVQPRADLFTNPPADALTRRRGVLASVLLVAVVDRDGDVAAGRLSLLAEKIQANQLPSVVALKRVPVLESPSNHNPAPTRILDGATAIENGSSLGRTTQLDLEYQGYPPTDPREDFIQVDTDGSETARKEEFDIAWFSGFGRFDYSHTLFAELDVFTPAKGTGIDLPPESPPGDYVMPFAVVVRDGRGGEAWRVRSVVVARP